MLISGLKIFLIKYKDDLFAITGGCGLLYFSTLDTDLAWFWQISGGLLLIWGIATFFLQLKSKE